MCISRSRALVYSAVSPMHCKCDMLVRCSSVHEQPARAWHRIYLHFWVFLMFRAQRRRWFLRWKISKCDFIASHKYKCNEVNGCVCDDGIALLKSIYSVLLLLCHGISQCFMTCAAKISTNKIHFYDSFEDDDGVEWWKWISLNSHLCQLKWPSYVARVTM